MVYYIFLVALHIIIVREKDSSFIKNSNVLWILLSIRRLKRKTRPLLTS